MAHTSIYIYVSFIYILKHIVQYIVHIIYISSCIYNECSDGYMYMHIIIII